MHFDYRVTRHRYAHMTRSMRLSLTSATHVSTTARRDTTHVVQSALRILLSHTHTHTHTHSSTLQSTKPGESPSSMPSLLDLPPELHAPIFELALTCETPLSLGDIYPDHHGETRHNNPHPHAPRSHTDRPANSASKPLPIFYASNAFAICLQPVCVEYIGERKGKTTRELVKKNHIRSQVAAASKQVIIISSSSSSSSSSMYAKVYVHSFRGHTHATIIP